MFKFSSHNQAVEDNHIGRHSAASKNSLPPARLGSHHASVLDQTCTEPRGNITLSGKAQSGRHAHLPFAPFWATPKVQVALLRTCRSSGYSSRAGVENWRKATYKSGPGKRSACRIGFPLEPTNSSSLIPGPASCCTRQHLYKPPVLCIRHASLLPLTLPPQSLAKSRFQTRLRGDLRCVLLDMSWPRRRLGAPLLVPNVYK